MIEFDHTALTINNLEESIDFYKKIGYSLQNQFEDEEYRWATLILGKTRLELFELTTKDSPRIEHIAYSFTNDKEVTKIVKAMGYNSEQLEVFYGDLNRKSFFIKDNNGLSIQFIKKNK